MKPVDLPETFAAAWADQRVIMYTDMAHNFGALVERGGDASSKQLRDLVAEGSQTSALRYLAARDGALRYRAGLADILKDYDAILTPSAPGVAPKGMATGNPAFNTLWTLTGLPAVIAAAAERRGRHADRRAACRGLRRRRAAAAHGELAGRQTLAGA